MAENISRLTFLVQSARACLGAALGGTLAAGCGRGGSASGAKAPGASRRLLAREEDVQTALYFVHGDLKGVLVRTPQGIVGYENKCPHDGAPVVLKENALVCVWQGSAFDPATGKPLKGPAKEPLAALKLEFKDGLVLLAGR
ncbi:MAG TPA: Rieske (2Fe-2S) protein [Planctomycetota bacterium]|nr:Rieske (2Fe-2S) protein [Planctomycetota bacterium]HRR81057.1 Rieske (2Fe-2S) protein [Planctomycetota bacterium]HRT97496.1 Rieske (2Fe-2S) protein [Planctomycetota bacterium]